MADAEDGALARTMRDLQRRFTAVVRRYHRLDVDIRAAVPDEPVLFVANHGFGGVFDLNVTATYAAFDDLRLTRPVTALVHQIGWILGAGPLIEPLGGRPASRASALDGFRAGHHVLVFPGGDIEAAKSFADRNTVTFAGRRGFAQLALDAGVPVVPIVTAGAGESALVLNDGQAVARLLRLDKVLRTKAAPISLSIPWGLSVGIAGIAPYLPLPTKLRTAVLPAVRPQESETAEEFGGRIESLMQSAMDDLIAGRRLLIG